MSSAGERLLKIYIQINLNQIVMIQIINICFMIRQWCWSETFPLILLLYTRGVSDCSTKMPVPFFILLFISTLFA